MNWLRKNGIYQLIILMNLAFILAACWFGWLGLWLHSGVPISSSQFFLSPLFSFAYLCLTSFSDRFFLCGGRMAPGFSSFRAHENQWNSKDFSLCAQDLSKYGSNCARCLLCFLLETPLRRKNPSPPCCLSWEVVLHEPYQDLPSNF